MTYYVLAVDGKTYGPVDIPGLTQWYREGRLVPNTRLRDAATGREMLASDVPELRGLFDLGFAPRPGYQYRPDPSRCPHCGGAMGPGQAQCAQCGMLHGPGIQPYKLLTGSATGDRILGFFIGFFSWFLWGLGAIGGLIVYFILKGSYPVFARSLGFGLATMILVFLGLIAVCFVGLAGMGR